MAFLFMGAAHHANAPSLYPNLDYDRDGSCLRDGNRRSRPLAKE
jgi:hypothetical protein